MYIFWPFSSFPFRNTPLTSMMLAAQPLNSVQARICVFLYYCYQLGYCCRMGVLMGYPLKSHLDHWTTYLEQLKKHCSHVVMSV